MLGLEQGAVELVPHQMVWDGIAKDTIIVLKGIFDAAALDIQHIGSTSISGIHAKPILDICVGVRALEDVTPYFEKLEYHGFIFRGHDVAEQLLFVMGDLKRNTRTHHVHIVRWNGAAWHNYINFRDYLNAFPEKANRYDQKKRRLADLFADNRKGYTQGKQELIDILLKEAKLWRMGTTAQ